MRERRNSRRIRTIQAAELISEHIRRKCVALDVSSTGAHLLVPGLAPEELPVLDEVMLVLASGRKQAAVRRWVDGEDVGFEFTNVCHLIPISGENHGRP
jgi:hypothetical protein